MRKCDSSVERSWEFGRRILTVFGEALLLFRKSGLVGQLNTLQEGPVVVMLPIETSCKFEFSGDSLEHYQCVR